MTRTPSNPQHADSGCLLRRPTWRSTATRQSRRVSAALVKEILSIFMEQKSHHILSTLNEDSWNEIRYWRRLFWGGWLLYLPVVGGLGILLTRLGITENVVVVMALAWMAAWAFVGIKLQLCKCPRCKERFFSRGLWGSAWLRFYNVFASRCLNCKIRIGTTGITPKG